MKTFKYFNLLLVFLFVTTFTFGQKYTGLKATASDGTHPTAIFDGNLTRGWQDPTNLDNMWLVVDLGSIKNINLIKIYWENANALSYSLSYSTDSVKFNNFRTYTNMPAGKRTDTISNLNIDCRYIKFQGIKRGMVYGYNIYEFEVYAAYTPVLTSLSLTPATSTISLGATKQFTVLGLDQAGNTIDFKDPTVWTVQGGGSIDTKGLFTSSGPGYYTITATNSGLTKTATVEILPINSNLSLATTSKASASSVNLNNLGVVDKPASYAIDGNTNTRWESILRVDPQWFIVDLGSVKTVSDIRIIWEGANARDYTIEASTDSLVWTTKFTQTGLPAGERTDPMYNLNFNARYVRMYGTSHNETYGYSIWEFQVYGHDVKATSNITPKVNDSYFYPNPATDRINISGEVAEVSFYSVQGQPVYSVKNKNVVDVATFARGLYLIKVTDKQGHQKVTKVEIR